MKRVYKHGKFWVIDVNDIKFQQHSLENHFVKHVIERRHDLSIWQRELGKDIKLDELINQKTRDELVFKQAISRYYERAKSNVLDAEIIIPAMHGNNPNDSIGFCKKKKDKTFVSIASISSEKTALRSYFLKHYILNDSLFFEAYYQFYLEKKNYINLSRHSDNKHYILSDSYDVLNERELTEIAFRIDHKQNYLSKKSKYYYIVNYYLHKHQNLENKKKQTRLSYTDKREILFASLIIYFSYHSEVTGNNNTNSEIKAKCEVEKLKAFILNRFKDFNLGKLLQVVNKDLKKYMNYISNNQKKDIGEIFPDYDTSLYNHQVFMVYLTLKIINECFSNYLDIKINYSLKLFERTLPDFPKEMSIITVLFDRSPKAVKRFAYDEHFSGKESTISKGESIRKSRSPYFVMDKTYSYLLTPELNKESHEQFREAYQKRLNELVAQGYFKKSKQYSHIVSATGISKSHVYSIIKYNEPTYANRDMIISILLPLKLSLQRFQELLSYRSFSFNTTDRDRIIRSCIDNEIYDIEKIDDYLYDHRWPTLFKTD